MGNWGKACSVMVCGGAGVVGVEDSGVASIASSIKDVSMGTGR